MVTSAQSSLVRRIDAGSPAARAGFHVHDQILLVEGRPVRNALDWAAVFARVETGKPVGLTVQRGGEVLQLSATFERRAASWWANRQSAFLLIARAMQLVTLVFAIAIGRRARDREAALGFWLLATISIYSVGLPPRSAVWWRELPLVVQFLFFLPSVSKVL